MNAIVLSEGDLENVRIALLLAIKHSRPYLDAARENDESSGLHAVYWWAREVGHYGRLALDLGVEQ
jgi:hypothetical protein